MDRDSVSLLEESLAQSDTLDSSSVNPRKRKKSSRACDFCHINHQPCDNGKPKCSYCERHGKSCLYLRPQKKRGPAQGYRSALHTMRESAAAWGAALNLIPSLGPVIEGYLKKSGEGQRLVRAIKDPQQQEFFIQAWQQSSVFKTFFGEDGAGFEDGSNTSGPSNSGPSVEAVPSASRNVGNVGVGMVNSNSNNSNGSASAVEADLLRLLTEQSGPSGHMQPQPIPQQQPQQTHHPSCGPPLNPMSLSSHETAALLKLEPKLEPILQQHAPTPSTSSHESANKAHPPQHTNNDNINNNSAAIGYPGPPLSLSLTDIVARDAARSSNTFSQTLGPLGFAPDETLNDFLALSYNPDPIENTVDYDPSLGSEMDQKAYYELLMGKQFT